MTSWAACATSLAPSWLDMLGRWGAKGSSVYVRTHTKRAKIVQTEVALKLRAAIDSPHDLLDEASVFLDLRRHLDERGCPRADIDGIIGRLWVYKGRPAQLKIDSPATPT